MKKIKKHKKEVMRRTIIIIDRETDKILRQSAKQNGLSASAYIRMLIRQASHDANAAGR